MFLNSKVIIANIKRQHFGIPLQTLFDEHFLSTLATKHHHTPSIGRFLRETNSEAAKGVT